MYLDHHGDARVRNTRTEEVAHIKMRQMGMFSGKDKRGITNAVIYNADGEPAYELYGKWTEALYYKEHGADDEDGIKIWEFEETPPDWEKIYRFSEFSLQLNNINNRLRRRLPPTDSRLRPDQRGLENGDLKEATYQK